MTLIPLVASKHWENQRAKRDERDSVETGERPALCVAVVYTAVLARVVPAVTLNTEHHYPHFPDETTETEGISYLRSYN